MRPLIGGINAVSLVNTHTVHNMSDCRSQNSKVSLERSASQIRTVQKLPPLNVLLTKCLGISWEPAGDATARVPGQTSYVGVYLSSLGR